MGVNESVYILGGQDKNGTVLDQVLKYDPVLHTYTQMAKMPGPRYRMGVTLLDSKLSCLLPRKKNLLLQLSVFSWSTIIS